MERFTEVEQNYIRILQSKHAALEYRDNVLEHASLEFISWATARGLASWDEYERAQHRRAVREFRAGTSVEEPGVSPKRLRPASVTPVTGDAFPQVAPTSQTTVTSAIEIPQAGFKVVLDEEGHPTAVANPEPVTHWIGRKELEEARAIEDARIVAEAIIEEESITEEEGKL